MEHQKLREKEQRKKHFYVCTCIKTYNSILKIYEMKKHFIFEDYYIGFLMP